MSDPTVPEWFRVPMVERVARALARQQVMRNMRWDEDSGRGGLPPDRIEAAVGHAWRDYATDARAVIAAMREPSLAIRKVCSFEAAEITWPAMIDAALAHPAPAEET